MFIIYRDVLHVMFGIMCRHLYGSPNADDQGKVCGKYSGKTGGEGGL